LVIVGNDTVKVTTTVSVQKTSFEELNREKQWKKQMYDMELKRSEDDKIRWKKDSDENDGLVNEYVKRRKPPVKN
jgi:phage protein U